MGLYEFLALDNEDQWNELFDNGEFIIEYEDIDSKCLLFALHRFYVEVDVDPVLGTKLGMNPFKNGKRLEKYTDQLDVDISE
ncbi:hypothetical protein [Pareuzebyella sediminis]|uniref:hypothetical protein n=1 Tax=Pareuzebyella sediminis TaxID=2607998 RepID=UPI0011ECB777|nr:hypothetical protein [Pareuzebyella sediminis]